MGVFQRIKDMTKASVNELLDKLEDPIVMLNQYLRDMEEEIAKAEVTVAKQMANERRLKQRVDEFNRLAQEREQLAMNALKDGQEHDSQTSFGAKSCTIPRRLRNMRACMRSRRHKRMI